MNKDDYIQEELVSGEEQEEVSAILAKDVENN